MGYDVYGGGEMMLGTERVAEASKALHDGLLSHTGVIGWSGRTEPHAPTDDSATLVEHLNEYLQGFCIYYTDGGDHIAIQAPDDSFRGLDDVENIFNLLAPFFDEHSDGFSWEGEDGYKWRWEIDKGKLLILNSEVVYGSDINAPFVVSKIIELVYPGGKPASSLPDYDAGQIMDSGHSACLSLIEAIESLLREHGFGPQAGMNELERMADV